MSPEYTEMLDALKLARNVIRHAAQESAGRVPRAIVGGWVYHAEQIEAVIAKAEKASAGHYYSLNVNKTVYTCLSIEEAEDMQARLGGSISHQFTNEG